MLAGVGLFSRPWAGRHGRDALFVLAFFVGSFSFLITHVQSRFLYSAMPFFTAMGGGGVASGGIVGAGVSASGPRTYPGRRDRDRPVGMPSWG